MVDRAAAVVAAMADHDIDALLLGRDANARFVADVDRLWLAGTRPFTPGCVVVRSTGAVHLLATSDVGVPASVPVDHLFPLRWNPEHLLADLAAIPGLAAARRVGVDGGSPRLDALLARLVPEAELVDGDALLRRLRRAKDPRAVAAIRRACRVAADGLAAAAAAAAPGVPERALRGVVAERLATHGVTTVGFEPTVSVLEPGAPRRRLGSERSLAAGDLVALHVSARLDGWHGEVARTAVVGGHAGTDLPEAATAWRTRWSSLLARLAPGTRVADLRAEPGVTLDGLGLGTEWLDDDDRLAVADVVAVTLHAGRDDLALFGGEVVHVTDRGADVLSHDDAVPARSPVPLLPG